jgi:PAS domain S-box-containing protein
MNSKNDEPKEVAELRSRAEEIAKGQEFAPLPENLGLMSPEEAQKLIHELRVHQIELKMQNDELRRTQAELDATRQRYFDLYNLAPVGYFVLSHDGRILETNLTGANLLGVVRGQLIKQPITRFIFEEDQDVYYLHRRQLLTTGKTSTCELRMVKTDGTTFWVRLTATTQDPSTSVDHGTDGVPLSRVVLTDISEQKPTKEQARPR